MLDFVNGKPQGIEAVYIMQSKEDWDRFMRFMERYSEDNGLNFYIKLNSVIVISNFSLN